MPDDIRCRQSIIGVLHVTQYLPATVEAYLQAKSHNIVDSCCSYPALYEALGPVVGLDVLDLATGDGKVARELVRKFGAYSAVGVDESPEMLRYAKRHNTSRIRFVEGTVGSLGHIGWFKRISAAWVFHYGKPRSMLDAKFRDVAANLAPDGIFAALNTNPGCPTGGAEEYGYTVTCDHDLPRDGDALTLRCFGNGASTEPITIYHWSFSTYAAAAHAAGLRLEVIIPGPTPQGIKLTGKKWWEKYMQRPTTAVFRCTHLHAA
jgi:SAM-dependent methyltransferase